MSCKQQQFACYLGISVTDHKVKALCLRIREAFDVGKERAHKNEEVVILVPPFLTTTEVALAIRFGFLVSPYNHTNHPKDFSSHIGKPQLVEYGDTLAIHLPVVVSITKSRLTTSHDYLPVLKRLGVNTTGMIKRLLEPHIVIARFQSSQEKGKEITEKLKTVKYESLFFQPGELKVFQKGGDGRYHTVS